MAKHEIEIIHPVVAAWLSDNGYDFESEVRIPGAGRADFVAQAKEGDVWLIVECKANANSIKKAVRQVLRYQSHFQREIKAALAVPKACVTDKIRDYCEQNKVILIEIDAPLGGATKSICVTPSTLRRFREFCDGMGVSYSQAIEMFLDHFIQPGENPVLAGYRLREVLLKPRDEETAERK